MTRFFALLLAALSVSATAAAQTTQFVELASANAAGTGAGNSLSVRPQTSADGRYVVFTSEAGDLVTNDANARQDVFVRDLQLGTTKLVSVNGSGTGSGNNGSGPASITPDGHYVVFASWARDLLPSVITVNSPLNVYRRDLQTDTTVLVSVSEDGTTPGGGNITIDNAVTPDGRFVLFWSSGALTADDTDGFSLDFFRRDLQTNTTALVTVTGAPTSSGGSHTSDEAAMSDDGRYVVFASRDVDLVPGAGPGTGFTSPSIYERDLVANTTTLVSERQVFQGTTATVPPPSSPSISSDGRYVFYKRVENFGGGLNRPGFRDRIFRRDRQTGELLELPFVATGICEQGFNCRSIIGDFVTSPDGRYVAYRQQEQPRSNPTPDSTAIVIRDMVGGGTEVVVGLPGVPVTMFGEVVHHLSPGNVTPGGKLAFYSGVPHTPGDANNTFDVYLFSPPSQNRLAFDQSSYTVTEDGVFGFRQGVRVRRAGYLADSTVTVKFETSDGTADAGADYAPRSETLTFAPGETEKDVLIQILNEEEIEPTPETINLTLGGPTGNAVLGARSAATLTINDDDPHFFQYETEAYDVSESVLSVLVVVTVTGTPTAPISVGYSTSDGTASERSDYVTARGRLHFAPGETSKGFRLLVTDDAFAEGVETINLSLFDPRGTNAAMGTTRATSVVRISSDDPAAPASNPIDASDFFVRQHYNDFLNRPPDAGGFQFWTNEIEQCGADAQCREVKRINVSAAFFLSIEFQTTGYLAYLTNRTAFGTRPLYTHFMYDVQTLQRDFVFGEEGAAAQLEANKRAYFDEFVTRTAFIAKYAGMDNAEYVRALLNDNGLSPTVGNVFVSRLDAAQVVPQTGSGATGVVIIRRDPTGNSPAASVSLSLRNLTGPPTAIHLHGPAAQGANVPAIITLPGGEFADFRLTLTGEQINWLNTGQLYIDVHTQSFPDGEIRARLGPALFRVGVLTGALNNQILTRAQVLRLVAEFDELRAAELNRAFVLMEYFGYLRRDPDEDGYNFWLGKLNEFGGDFVRAEMVKAFINSAEYRRRFGQ